MLEQRTLLLCPWDPPVSPSDGGDPDASTPPRRAITDPETGEPRGVVRRQPVDAPSWWRWLVSPLLEVHEAGDEPLLCSVQRFWSLGQFWEVRDADGNRVALVRRNRVKDRWDQDLAVRIHQADGSTVWVRNPGGTELATLTPTAAGRQLRFTEAVEKDPFTKMALLAAALVLDEEPA